MDWYSCFLACIFLLWAFAAPRDRVALRIILIASLFSEVFVEMVTRHIPGAWKLAIPGAVEVLTIGALLQFSPNKTGYLQIFCLFFAWLAHMLCYLDITLRTDIVYSRYETILLLVAVAQIMAFYETIAYRFSAFADWVCSPRLGGSHGFRVAGMRARVLPDEGAQVVQPVHGTKEVQR